MVCIYIVNIKYIITVYTDIIIYNLPESVEDELVEAGLFGEYSGFLPIFKPINIPKQIYIIVIIIVIILWYIIVI